MTSGSRSLRAAALGSAALLLFAAAVASNPASAQQPPGDAGASALREGEGRIAGRVTGNQTGAGIEGVTVVLTFPSPPDGGAAHQELQATDSDGNYVFASVPVGGYRIEFLKTGYGAARITHLEVVSGRESRADSAISPRAGATAEGGEAGSAPPDTGPVESITVHGATAADLLGSIEKRQEADQLVNLLSAEELSQFAATDVADALKRVAGINIVEGQFAIIRGLEERYSSTLYNGAPVPSPDPDKQSVQLDLFPSDIVTSLVVAKSFAPGSPGNSSGGSLDILTDSYPRALEAKVSVGGGFEEGARERFLEFQSGSTAGIEADASDIIESDVGGSIGGSHVLFGREIRFKALVNHEVDYRTEEGFQDGREPRPQSVFPIGGVPTIVESGGLALGELALSDGHFEQTKSTRDEQLTGYAGLGVDLDDDGAHRLDASYFFTRKQEEAVDLRENGYFPGFDYTPLSDATDAGDDLIGPLRLLDRVATLSSRLAFPEKALRVEPTEPPERGALWFSSFGRTGSFDEERELQVLQLNGVHRFDLLEGLEVSWVGNRAETSQDETALGMRFFYEPCGYSGQFGCPAGVSRIPAPRRFPVTVSDLGVGRYFASGASGGIVFSDNQIDESQWFGRLDAEQSFSLGIPDRVGWPFGEIELEAKGGAWWEDAKRDIDAFFVETVSLGGLSQWSLDSATLPELGSSLFDRLDPLGAGRSTTSKSEREITAEYVNFKATFLDDVDLLAGLRFEQIFIDSENDPFTGQTQFGRPQTFPVAYLFFDRVDSSLEGFLGDPSTTTFPDQILGIDVPVDPATGLVDLLTREEILALVNGEIDEQKVLPSVGLNYRPLEGLTLRGAFSQTVARPSFREIGYYVSVEPGTDDRTVGNPQLQLSEVESYDVRADYVFGSGDLVALSAFYKTIDDPIESIVLRNPLDFDSGSAALFRTFFNNPNQAKLWGIEAEARKSLDFLYLDFGLEFPGSEALDYLSVGGNFTYVDAEVDRTAAEIARTREYFGVAAGDVARFGSYERSRRLFGQPEWIANADVTFDHPDWGTTATLAFFAISDVLDATGTATLAPNASVVSFTLDRYLDQYHQLDLVVSQKIWRGLVAKVSVKNLTDSTRRRIYDPEQTVGRVTERSWSYGRDWSFSLGYTHEF
jgi:outer membrane receptor protein involved in Fe transport